jgi:hypothetical protein
MIPVAIVPEPTTPTDCTERTARCPAERELTPSGTTALEPGAA